jgi:putative Holliday junction resolvase
MALEYGEARIGVALSDPTGMLAQPFETIERGRPGDDAWLERIAVLVAEYGVDCIVVGLPLSMDGRAGESAARARAFGERVSARTGVRVAYLDERWTSREAERVLREAEVKPRRRKRHVDPIAAALILSAWLARQRA